MRPNNPCPSCVADGVSVEDAIRNAHISTDPKYQRDGRPTAICFRVNHHANGGNVVYFDDTGEVCRIELPSPYQWLCGKAENPGSRWGVTSSQLRIFGVRTLTSKIADDFRSKFPEVCKRLPSHKTLADAEVNGDPVFLFPLCGAHGGVGVQIRIDRPKTGQRPGDSGMGSGGKQILTLGESGAFISIPFPDVVPSAVVVLEGGKDVCVAASDAQNDGDHSTVFVGVSANFNAARLRETLEVRFPGIPIVAIADRDQAGLQFTKKMNKIGAVSASLSGCSGNDIADEPSESQRRESMKMAIADAVREWMARREIRGGNDGVWDRLRAAGCTAQDDVGNLRVLPRPIALKIVLEWDPAYGTKFQRNLMGEVDTLNGDPLRDEDITAILVDLDNRYRCPWSIDAIDRQVRAQCALQAFHPVRAYFDELPIWDETCRYSWLLKSVLGADPSPLNIALIRCFFVGAVARVMEPGYKHDTVLTLNSSAQGIGKTTFFRRLIGSIPYAFLEGQEDVQSKDALLAMHRAFIVEIGEIDRIIRSKDAEILKNFLSRQADVIRSPYGRRHQDRPRSFVVVGTTNQGGFLVDPTGHRRFHVIETGSKPFPLELLEESRDQLWAQAVAEYKAGVPSWLSSEMTALHQAKMRDFELEDPWEIQVAKVIWEISKEPHYRSYGGVTIAQVLSGMKIAPEGQTPQASKRVRDVLRKRRWKSTPHQTRIGGDRLRLWIPPEDDPSWFAE